MSIKTCMLFEYNPEFWILIHENIWNWISI